MKIKKIESSSNPLFKKLISLTKRKGIEEHSYCIVSGEKVVAEVAQNCGENAFWVFTEENHPLFNKFQLEQLILLPKALFDEVDVVGTHAPLLCTDARPIDEWDPEEEPMGHELLCALGDPNNLGALIRSARAFGIEDIVLLEEACHPFHPKAIKASAGASFHMNYYFGPSIQKLNGVKNILALDGGGKDISTLKPGIHYRILLGEEGQGVPKNVEFEKVAIPIAPEVESLNATVAASILLRELTKK